MPNSTLAVFLPCRAASGRLGKTVKETLSVSPPLPLSASLPLYLLVTLQADRSRAQARGRAPRIKPKRRITELTGALPPSFRGARNRQSTFHHAR